MNLNYFLTNISNSVNGFMDKVSSHAKNAEGSVIEKLQLITKIHAQYQLNQQRLSVLETRYQELETKIESWQQRAAIYAKTDKDKTLHAMQTIQYTQDEAIKVMSNIYKARRLNLQLENDLHEAEVYINQPQSQEEISMLAEQC